jgi:hypothetical protein
MPRRELELAIEYPSPDEDEYTDKLARVLKQKVADSYPPGKTLRDAHPKQHGCVMAEFIVDSEIPQEWRIGVFKEARAFPALIRFSNASPTVSPDYKKDCRGMAIKLLGVEGEKLLEGDRHGLTHDFITISFDSFFSKSPRDLYFFTVAFFSGALGALWYFFNPFKPHVGTFLSIFKSAQRHTSPLDIRYWSMTPYLFGSQAVKYSVVPWRHIPATIPKNHPECYLRENMQQQLAHDPFYFDFMIQFQTDPYTMPIEDPTVPWDEKVSPFHKLATIVIPPQNFDTAARMEFGDNLSYNPWRCLPEHRPLGGINRCRNRVYQAISAFRHERNDTPEEEPAPNFTLASLEQGKASGA